MDVGTGHDRLDKLTEFQVWLEARGLRTAPTRVGDYLRRLSGFTNGPRFNELAYEDYNDLVFLLREVDELIWIHQGLICAEPLGSVALLEKTLSGPRLTREEGPDRTARNYQLELRIASYFLHAGFEVDLSEETDLRVTMDSGTLYVECKRVGSPNKVRSRAKQARKQLRNRVSRHRGRSRPFGLVMLDVSRVLHPGQGVSSGQTAHEVEDGLQSQLLAFAEEYRIENLFAQEKDVLAIWTQITVPTVHSLGPNTRFSSLCERLAPLVGPRAAAFQELRKALEVARKA